MKTPQHSQRISTLAKFLRLGVPLKTSNAEKAILLRKKDILYHVVCTNFNPTPAVEIVTNQIQNPAVKKICKVCQNLLWPRLLPPKNLQTARHEDVSVKPHRNASQRGAFSHPPHSWQSSPQTAHQRERRRGGRER